MMEEDAMLQSQRDQMLHQAINITIITGLTIVVVAVLLSLERFEEAINRGDAALCMLVSQWIGVVATFVAAPSLLLALVGALGTKRFDLRDHRILSCSVAFVTGVVMALPAWTAFVFVRYLS